MKLFDLHTHTVLSDGALLPAEFVRRAHVNGYQGLAITDHMDSSNMEIILPGLVRACEEFTKIFDFPVVAGAELTHVPPVQIEELTKRARELGAKIVLVHGETIVEPVAPGTNRAAIEAGVDILAHPGLIDEDTARLAAQRGVALEISAKAGHSLTNGHVASVAKKCGATLVLGSDAHEPEDILTPDFAVKLLKGAGLGEEEIEEVFVNAEKILMRKI